MNHLGQDLTNKPVELYGPDIVFARVLRGSGCEPGDPENPPATGGDSVTIRLDTGKVQEKVPVALVKRICQELELEAAIVTSWNLRCTECCGQGETYTREPNEYGGILHKIAFCEHCRGTGLEENAAVPVASQGE